MSAPREPDERGANGQKTCDGWAFRSIKDNGCPLFAIEPTVNNVGDLLAIVKRVTQNQVVETGTTTSPNAVIQRLCRITGADEFVELKYLKAPRI